jgi:primosomal protein N' (replication factor Y) (superfamily II helicase)
MFVKVIVDIKIKNVNRPFTYQVPKHFEAVIEIGMRVIVPFGNRELLGYVIEIEENGDLDYKIKPIIALMDLIPALTPELLELAKQIANETSSFLVNCIQAMLPVAIKAKYRKKLVKLIDHLPLTLQPYFENQKEIDFESIKQEDLTLVKQAIKVNQIELVYDIQDKGKIKYDTFVSLNIEKIDQVSKSAKKQKEVIDFLVRCETEVLKSILMHELKLSHATYQSMLKKAIISERSEEHYRDPYHHLEQNAVKHPMTEEQQNAYDEVMAGIKASIHKIFLLHGITGSGKTEVYLNVIEEVIRLDKEAILLVPEIALTPQIVRQFKNRFGNDVAVLHSGLSDGEKYDEWRRIRKGEVKVAVGARSAIFAPFMNLGIIIVDEEHESTYKQGEMPKYHAVEVAKMRTQNHQCVLVLGSATPSLESYARAVKGVYHLLEMHKRATNMELPETKIVDMTNEYKHGNLSILSKTLHAEIVKRLAKNEQIILLLNRRGYENFLMCRSCGHTMMCQNCDVSLTFHKSNHRLKCHYCGYDESIPQRCPMCGDEHIKGFGYGTQKVEEELMKVFPDAGILRMDNDTTSNKGDHERILNAFRDKKAHILIGTQMIAKGLDFEDVTLVGVLLADTSLKLPDFRSSEKTFQLITQVAGRAGRHKAGSQVIIQTYNPTHYAIIAASKNHYKAFFNHEMKMRKMGMYVPYYFMCQILVTSDQFQMAMKQAEKIARYIKAQVSEQTIVLGPVVPSIKRINNLYQTQLIVKYKDESRLRTALESILISYSDQAVQVTIDMYPHFLL